MLPCAPYVGPSSPQYRQHRPARRCAPVELAEALQAILDEDPEVKTQRDLAKMIGKRESWVSDMLRILTLPPALQQELRTSETTVPYDAVMRISRVDDVKKQAHLVKDVIEGKSPREIRAKIEEIKGKKVAVAMHKKAAKKPEPVKDQTYRIDLPSGTVTVNFKKGERNLGCQNRFMCRKNRTPVIDANYSGLIKMLTTNPPQESQSHTPVFNVIMALKLIGCIEEGIVNEQS